MARGVQQPLWMGWDDGFLNEYLFWRIGGLCGYEKQRSSDDDVVMGGLGCTGELGIEDIDTHNA